MGAKALVLGIAPSGGIGLSPGMASGCSISVSATRMIAFSSGAMRSTVQPSASREMIASVSGV